MVRELPVKGFTNVILCGGYYLTSIENIHICIRYYQKMIYCLCTVLKFLKMFYEPVPVPKLSISGFIGDVHLASHCDIFTITK